MLGFFIRAKNFRNPHILILLYLVQTIKIFIFNISIFVLPEDLLMYVVISSEMNEVT